MLFYIEIADESLDLINALNKDGVPLPKLEKDDMTYFFVYNPDQAAHHIITEDEFEKVMLSFARTTVKTLRIGESAGVGELARQQLRKTRILEP